MGRNFYLKYFYPEEESVDSFEEKESKFVAEDGYHIGKSSAGWAFLFDFDLFRVWEHTGYHRWNVVREFWDSVSEGRVLETENLMEPIYVESLDMSDINLALTTPGYRIVCEEGRVYTLQEFMNIVYTRMDPVYTLYSYQKEHGPSGLGKGKYVREFRVAGHWFSSFTNFS